jgi:PAS domain S-box-containing protein
MKIHKSYLFRNIKFEFRITLIYFIFGLLWILFSDIVLDLVVNNESLLTEFQTYKGAFFIIVTSVFLYLLVNRHMHSLRVTESQLSDSEFRFNKLYENGPFGIVLVNKDFKFIKTNSAFCSIIGYSETELQEFTFKDISHSVDLVKDLPNISKLINKELTVYKTEKRFIRKDGQIIWGSLTVIANNDSNGQFLYNLGIIEDITDRKRIENEFFESQLNFHRSISESPVGIRIVTIEGKTIYANKAFLDIYNFDSLEEFISAPTTTRYLEESQVQHKERKEQRKKGNDVFDYEISIVSKNDKIRHVKVSRKEVLWNGTKHFQVINIDVTDQRNAEEQLRRFASHLQNVREEEKVALAREIHDDLGQNLVALKIDIGLLKKKVVKNDSFVGSEEMLAKFDSLISLVDKTIKTARRIMNGLRPELLEMHGLVDTIKAYLHEFNKRYHICCEFKSNILEIEINQQQKLALYRILQEALNNIAKHSKATLVTIQLNKEPYLLMLEIIDNGIGFDKNNSGRHDSYGMIGMKERVVLLEGKLEITSETDKGTCVKVEIPVPKIEYK